VKDEGKWEDWMVEFEGEGIIDGAAKEPSQKLIPEWLINMCHNIPKATVQNFWKKIGFEWI
jgi:hypothetical protein